MKVLSAPISVSRQGTRAPSPSHTAKRGRPGGGLWGAVLFLFALAIAPSARADSTVIVLSVRALDGDDALAGSLSEALRVKADEVPNWSVSDREVSLAQMSLAHGCEGTTAACMADIAKTLHVDRLIYGTSQEVDGGVALELHNFDAVTGLVEGTYQETLPATALDPGALERTAHTIAMHLSGAPPTGAIMVTSNVAEAQVLLDGQVMGALDEDGEHMLEDVSAGGHVVALEHDGQHEQLQLKVQPGETAMAHLELIPPVTPVAMPEPASEPSPAQPEDGRKGMRITGWALVGTAGALLISAGAAWGRIQSINKDQDLKDYRAMFPPTTSDVCGPARMNEGGDGTRPGIAQRVASLCDSGQALEKAQWGLLAGSIATAIVGTTLLVVGRKKERAQVALLPRLSVTEAGLDARMTF